ncbi:MAG: ABC transporter substrate-binding protein [Lachnospiraceae bacterium]|nr:ABC transporter substrate-binding protein [Lachnospiraceae bacterium]
MMRRKLLSATVLLSLMGFLVACGSGGETGDIQTLTVACVGIGKEDDGSFSVPSLDEPVQQFQEDHEEYQVVLTAYQRSAETDEDELALLQREIVSGEGPDVILFFGGYDMTDMIGNYTEDLYSWLEEGWEDLYFENILDAFSYEGKLPALPLSFTLKSIAVSDKTTGDRSGWTMEEMMDCYETACEASGEKLLLYAGESKKDVFALLLTANLSDFVDWETGECQFESDSFQRILEFANRFPLKLNLAEDFSIAQAYGEGKCLIYPVSLSSVYDIAVPEAYFGEDVTFIGYPARDGDGTIISAGSIVVAISALSGQKEAAWEFISQFLEEEYQREKITYGFPVSKTVLLQQIEDALNIEIEYEEGADGTSTPVVKRKVSSELDGTIAEIYQITETQKEQLLQIIERVSKGTVFDAQLNSLILDETQGYFAGEKTVEETMEVIQSIAKMYVNENLD